MNITCAEFEVLLADWVDGTLAADQKAQVEAHAAECAACAELARDAAGAMAMMERAALVEPPPPMVNRILFEAISGYSRVETRPSWFARWLGPIVQPRFAMGMAMTALSIVMLGRYTGIEIRQLKPSDLNPAAVWSATENRAHRVWTRAVKEYENLKLVYDVQTRLQEWNDNASNGAEEQQ